MKSLRPSSDLLQNTKSRVNFDQKRANSNRDNIVNCYFCLQITSSSLSHAGGAGQLSGREDVLQTSCLMRRCWWDVCCRWWTVSGEWWMVSRELFSCSTARRPHQASVVWNASVIGQHDSQRAPGLSDGRTKWIQLLWEPVRTSMCFSLSVANLRATTQSPGTTGANAPRSRREGQVWVKWSRLTSTITSPQSLRPDTSCPTDLLGQRRPQNIKQHSFREKSAVKFYRSYISKLWANISADADNILVPRLIFRLHLHLQRS